MTATRLVAKAGGRIADGCEGQLMADMRPKLANPIVTLSPLRHVGDTGTTAFQRSLELLIFGSLSETCFDMRC